MKNEYRTLGDWYELDRYPEPLTREEEQQCLQDGDTTKLITCNLRFAVTLAKQFRGCGCDLEDLVQEAALGLVEAAQKAKPNRQNRFLTYAGYYMRRNVRRAVARSRLVAMPYYIHESMAQWHAVNHTLLFELGREPTFEEAYQEADIAVSADHLRQFLRLCKASQQQANGNLPLDSGAYERVESRLDNYELATRVLRSLDAMDAVLLWLRYGEEQTLQSCSKVVGRCRETVRQRIEKAKGEAVIKLAVGGSNGNGRCVQHSAGRRR